MPDDAPHLLLAEDDDPLRDVMTAFLEEAGFQLTVARDGQHALEAFSQLDQGTLDAVIADINMPRLDGLELITHIHNADPHLPVIFVTAYSSVDSAVDALRKGAFDYLTKPFRNDRLIQVARNASRQRRLTRENSSLRTTIQQTLGVQDLLARSPGLEDVLALIERAAPTSASVLIHGETGTGKELVARALHQLSPRASHPFVSINCGALPEGLLESELFGHEKGAFSGAVAPNKGLFRAAHRGTLFLDELGEMPPPLQVKLLRVLESREVRPVGATKPIPIDVRILAATHRDLLDDVQQGRFREDLYYRLAVLELDIPPLRARPQDITPLASHFLDRLAQERSLKPRPSLSPELISALETYDWPGNVRELRNAIEHAATLGGPQLQRQDLPPRLLRKLDNPQTPQSSAHDDLPTLAELERRHVQRVLEHLDGDRRRAAETLGIDLSTLYRKLKRWDKDAAPD